MQPTRRLFFGLLPPDETRAALAAALDDVGGYAPRARRARPANLHLTLLFVGDQLPDHVPQLERAMAAVAAATSAFSLTVAGAGTFGQQVLWAGVAGDVTAAAGLAEALAGACGHPLDRPWRGHITLARARGRRGDPALLAAVPPLADRVFGPLLAHELKLFESVSGPDGVCYEVRASESLAIRH